MWCVAHVARPGKAAHPALLTRTPHKAEWKGGKEGLLWFSKACESARIATTIVNPELKMARRSSGTHTSAGGAVGPGQSYLLQGVVVLAKDWDWAAFTIDAAKARTNFRNQKINVDSKIILLFSISIPRKIIQPILFCFGESRFFLFRYR